MDLAYGRRKRIENGRFQRNSSCIPDKDEKKLTHKKLGRQGNRVCWSSKKLCKAEGIQIYLRTSETKAAFAEFTIRPLKSILNPYKEDYGYKYIHKLFQFVTTLLPEKNAR